MKTLDISVYVLYIYLYTVHIQIRAERITPPVASKITGDFEAKVTVAALGPLSEGSGMALQAYLCLQSCSVNGGMYMRLNAAQKAIAQK